MNPFMREEIAIVMAEMMRGVEWIAPEISPVRPSARSVSRPTGVAKSKREAKKRKNIRARSAK